MKISNYFLISTLCILSFFACNNDDDNNGINTGDDCTASWKVDGEDYNVDNMALCVYLDNTLNLSTIIGGGELLLQIDPITSTGTYVADPFNQDLNVIVLITLNNGTQIGSDNATVTVSELSSAKAKGTFSGTFFDIMDLNSDPIYTVTDGTFSANF